MELGTRNLGWRAALSLISVVDLLVVLDVIAYTTAEDAFAPLTHDVFCCVHLHVVLWQQVSWEKVRLLQLFLGLEGAFCYCS